MCGLVGFSGVGKPNIDWLKILALSNDSRGGDGVGYGNQDIIVKGITHRTFYEFFQKEQLDIDNNNVIIMHTRKSSKGAILSTNNHPFGIYNTDNDTEPSLIGVHNGTIRNIMQLALAYSREPWYDAIHKLPFNCTDSEVLFNLLHFSKEYKVLEKFEGAATIMWYDPAKPKELYVFKGGDEYGIPDRPLFYLTNKKKTYCYLSSLEAPLKIIAGEDDKVLHFPTNKVVMIKNGKLNVLKDINRTDAYAHQSRYANYGGYSTSEMDYYDRHYAAPRQEVRMEAEAYKTRRTKNKDSRLFMLESDRKHIIQSGASKGGKIYMDEYLYKRNGHVLHGIYKINAHGTIEYLESDLNGLASYISDKQTLANRELYAFYKGVLLFDNDRMLHMFNNRYMTSVDINMFHTELCHKFFKFYISRKTSSVFFNQTCVVVGRIKIPLTNITLVLQKSFIKFIEKEEETYDFIHEFNQATNGLQVDLSELRDLIDKYKDVELDETELAVYNDLETFYNNKI